MDALTQFLMTEQFDRVWACLGNPVTGAHLLVEADSLPLSEANNLKARLGGYEFSGVFGFRFRDCYADLVCEPGEGPSRVMFAATTTFLRHLAEVKYRTDLQEGLAPKTAGKGVDWLERLHSLIDPRTLPN